MSINHLKSGDDVMVTSCQFFDKTLPDLDIKQVSTQSDLGFVHN